MTDTRVVVTGASSGIGAATVRLLRAHGRPVTAVARREDRLRALAEETGCEWVVADLTSDDDVARLVQELERSGGAGALVNNAGGARGLDSVEHGSIDDWRWMYEVNVIATKRVTSALLPMLRDAAEASGVADVVTITSTAEQVGYEGGGGYNAAKFAVRAMSRVLRQELLGRPIRITEIAPGMVKTEFSLVRLRGDERGAEAVYEGMTPLTPEDVADCIAFAVTRPSHVNIDTLVVLARDQSGATTVHRS
jgi:NADP-dependent 3-hydroxy acid dehydrogenase YdfG